MYMKKEKRVVFNGVEITTFNCFVIDRKEYMKAVRTKIFANVV